MIAVQKGITAAVCCCVCDMVIPPRHLHLWCFIAKAVLFVTKPDIKDASGCLQMCGGQIAGIEAAVHAVRTAFKQDGCERVLLVDASNAFNSLNRQTAMLNIQQLCPPLANIIINCYRSPTDLFVDGEVLLSEEGTTQGDPLAMPMYGL